MKKWMALLLGLMMTFVCSIACAQERTVAPYTYELTPDGAYMENMIFPGDVIISGDQSQMAFSNCAFEGNIILTANEATRVMLFGCELNGAFIFQNEVREATIDDSLPKVLTDGPITVVIEEGAGTAVALGQFEITVDGTVYTMQDSQLFSDATNPEAGFVPYEGQEAHYFVVSQWVENGENVLFLLCEYDPTM